MLKINHFKKYYGSKLALESSDYSFSEGIHWVKGHNGSGKTTLFKSLAGILPFEGEVHVDAISLKKEPVSYRLHVNYAEAEPVFPSVTTGNELVRLFERHKKAPAGQAATLTERLGIGFLAEPTGTYSSGMGKKLSLLLAFLGRPLYILLDEPLVTLDQAAVSALIQLIKERKAQGVSFLISSHQVFEEGTLTPDFVHEVSNGMLHELHK
jgi:ABC-2 type transport system ATP-binding protein